MGGEHDYFCTFFSTDHESILYIYTQQMFPVAFNDRRSSLYFVKLSKMYFIQADAHKNATR